jgi:hypothetical protein
MGEVDDDNDVLARVSAAFVAGMRAHDGTPIARDDVVGSGYAGAGTGRYGRSHLVQWYGVKTRWGYAKYR